MLFRVSRSPLVRKEEACTRTIQGQVEVGVGKAAPPVIKAAFLRRTAIVTGSVVAVVAAVAAVALGTEVEDDTEPPWLAYWRRLKRPLSTDDYITTTTS